jgi:hypothetical protein
MNVISYDSYPHFPFALASSCIPNSVYDAGTMSMVNQRSLTLSVSAVDLLVAKHLLLTGSFVSWVFHG